MEFFHCTVAERFFLVVQHIRSFQIIVLFSASKLPGFNFLAVDNINIVVNLNNHGIVSFCTTSCIIIIMKLLVSVSCNYDDFLW